MADGTMTWDGHETWYRVFGEIDGGPGHGPTPVIVCHGGPGAAHDYTEPIAELSRFGRASVLYDQLRCENSQHLPDAPAEFWTPQLFKDELVALTRHLGIAARHAVVGQSWAACSRWSKPSTIPKACAGSWSPTRRRAWSSGCRRRTGSARTSPRRCRQC